MKDSQKRVFEIKWKHETVFFECYYSILADPQRELQGTGLTGCIRSNDLKLKNDRGLLTATGSGLSSTALDQNMFIKRPIRRVEQQIQT